MDFFFISDVLFSRYQHDNIQFSQTSFISYEDYNQKMIISNVTEIYIMTLIIR